MAVQGPFKKYFSLQNWILKIQKWQKVGALSFSCREWGYEDLTTKERRAFQT